MDTKKLIILLIGCLLATGCTREIMITQEKDHSPEGKVPVSIQIVWDGTPKSRADQWEYDDFFPEIREEEKK